MFPLKNLARKGLIRKFLPAQQDLQMPHLPVHLLYHQSAAEDLQISQRLFL